MNDSIISRGGLWENWTRIVPPKKPGIFRSGSWFHMNKYPSKRTWRCAKLPVFSGTSSSNGGFSTSNCKFTGGKYGDSGRTPGLGQEICLRCRRTCQGLLSFTKLAKLLIGYVTYIRESSTFLVSSISISHSQSCWSICPFGSVATLIFGSFWSFVSLLVPRSAGPAAAESEGERQPVFSKDAVLFTRSTPLG